MIMVVIGIIPVDVCVDVVGDGGALDCGWYYGSGVGICIFTSMP